jgi:hypothetical protein
MTHPQRSEDQGSWFDLTKCPSLMVTLERVREFPLRATSSFIRALPHFQGCGKARCLLSQHPSHTEGLCAKDAERVLP